MERRTRGARDEERPAAADGARPARGLRAGGEILPLIEKEQLEPLTEWYNAGGKAEAETLAEKEAIPYGEAVYGPLYRNPQRIFGIGLNYKDHAGDLGEKTPQVFPGSFYKPASCIAGPGDEIKIPALPEAQKTTAEAELGVIIGKKCKFIEEKDWLKYVAGYTTILDMTEESILRLNPRYLTIVKGFDTFFTFGPQLVTPDEVPDVSALEVATVHNGEVHAKNTVSNMTFSPRASSRSSRTCRAGCPATYSRPERRARYTSRTATRPSAASRGRTASPSNRSSTR